ncbi:unnamed protein product [Debaryomyces tyrocola]|nr:unnamed protein product [Debaryomyces tyrocola]
MSQMQDIKAKQTKDEGGSEDKPSDKKTKVEKGREEQEKSGSGYLGEEKLNMNKLTTVGGTDNQQTASAALSQQQQPQKAPPQIPPYMGYYNGVMPPFYQSFPYSNVSNAPYKYYGPKVSQTYSGTTTNQIPQESHQPNYQTIQPQLQGQSQAPAQNQLQPSAKQPQMSSQQVQALQDHQHHHQQMSLPQHNSPHGIGVENFQISQYQPTNTFKVGRPKKAEDKISKNKFNSKFKTKSINDRPYACSFPGCDWAFARQSDLRRHAKSHSEPSYHCPYWRNDPTCHRNGGAFNRLDVLKRHLKLVHYVQDKHQIVDGSKEDPGWCRACQRMFPNSKTFIDHCLECAQQLTPAEWKSNDPLKPEQNHQLSSNHSNQGIHMSHQYISNNPQTHNDNQIYQISDIPKINNQDTNSILQSPPPNTASSGNNGHENSSSVQNENKDNESFFLEKIPSNPNQNFNVFNNAPHTNSSY